MFGGYITVYIADTEILMDACSDQFYTFSTYLQQEIRKITSSFKVVAETSIIQDNKNAIIE